LSRQKFVFQPAVVVGNAAVLWKILLNAPAISLLKNWHYFYFYNSSVLPDERKT
jgi:hypothetical protein